MLGGQNLNTGDNSEGYQANRDIIINQYGLNNSEVNKMIEDYFEKKVPEKITEIVKKNIEVIQGKIKHEVNVRFENLKKSQIENPENYYLAHEIIKSAGLKGDKANGDILAKLLGNKLITESSLVSKIINDAIAIVPNLTKEQIQFLGFVFYMTRITFVDTTFEQLNTNYLVLYNHIRETLDLNGSKINDLLGKGLLIIDIQMTKGEYIDVLKVKYPYLINQNDLNSIYGYIPNVLPLKDIFERGNINNYVVTPVGDAIAITFLQQSGFNMITHEGFIR